MERRAKIVATVGPATRSEKNLRRLLKAGVDVVRINLSHGTSDEHRRSVKRIRALAAELERPIAVMLDLMGPRFRLGRIEGEMSLKRRATVTMGAEGNDADLPLDDASFLNHMRRGERLLIADGRIELEILSKHGKRADAKVVFGGNVTSRKGINLPDTNIPFTISEKDRRDLALADELKADWIAASYVGRAHDLDALRRAMARGGEVLPLIAKLERARAVEHLEEIVAAADAVMVARGDLGVELPLDRVPVLQKRIIDAARRQGKAVIVATQMLESMISQPRPTRAESSDVANAVFDGADALMLSGETAIGQHPVATVKTMDAIIRRAEAYVRERNSLPGAPAPLPFEPLKPLAIEREEADEAIDRRELDIPGAVAAAAVEAARHLGAKQIVALSQGGFTARLVARYRPQSPFTVFTIGEATARRIQLLWGVRPLTIASSVRSHDEIVHLIDRRLRAMGMVHAGDLVVLLMGDPIPERPLTNLIRAYRIRDE